jgi:hypothetical protein
MGGISLFGWFLMFLWFIGVHERFRLIPEVQREQRMAS